MHYNRNRLYFLTQGKGRFRVTAGEEFLKIVAGQLEIPQSGQRRSLFGLKGWQLDGLALLFFVALTVFMTWPVAPNLDHSLEQWGDALLQTWTLDWDAHALVTNPLHFADANAFYPYHNSLAFTETLVGQAILVAPVIWLTNNPVLAYNLLLLASFILCGWGTYLLAKDLTGSRVAALGAGVIFGFFPHRFGQLSHLHLLAAQWMPFSLLFLRRFILQKYPAPDATARTGQLPAEADPGEPTGLENSSRKPQKSITVRSFTLKSYRSGWLNIGLFGVFFGLELLSSTYLGLFLVATVGLYLLYVAARWAWQNRHFRRDKNISWQKRIDFNKIARLCVVMIVVGLVVLPFYYPYLAVQQDLGFQRSASEVQSFSAQPFYYLDVPKENKLNQLIYRPLFTQNFWQSSSGGERGLYLGLGAMLLGLLGAIIALRRVKQDRDGLFFVILALVAVSFTFGPAWQTGRFGEIPLPYALLYNYVPGFAAIRVPVRFIYVVALAVAVLAAYGIAWLQQRFRLSSAGKAGVLAVALVVLLSGEYWSDVNLQSSNVLVQPKPAVESWLDAHPEPALRVPLSGSDNSNLFLQYWTRGSWRPIMNGFSGFMPPAYDALKLVVAREGFSPRLLELLQGLEVRYIVIDSEDPDVKPQWAKFKSDLAKSGVGVAQQFGSTYIYELKADPWLARLKDLGIKPGSSVYFVEYPRSGSALLELAATMLDRAGVTPAKEQFGNISIGFRSLPALPAGRPADFLVIQAGEDPSLYGFRAGDKIFGNDFLAVYKKNDALLARYDAARQDDFGLINRTEPLIVKPSGSNGLEFKTGAAPAAFGEKDRYLSLGIGSLEAQTIQVQTGGSDDNRLRLQLQPGLSTLVMPLGGGVSISSLSGKEFSLAWVEEWQGSLPAETGPTLRPDVALLSTQTGFDQSTQSAQATVKVVAPPRQDGYTATMDIYNTPWGSHPSGHYGYWSVPVAGGNGITLDWQLQLTRKEMATRQNGGMVPNYPPDPKDLDLAKYGNLGDFRANLNLFSGGQLDGQIRLFDFTVYAQGDKNRVENRRAGAFKGYNTALTFIVLPGKS